MENDLVSIYENNFLPNNRSVIEEKTAAVADTDESDDDAEITTNAGVASKSKTKKTKKSMSKKEIGGITYDSHKRSETIFDKILREMDEMGGGNIGSVGDDDSVYDAGDDNLAGDGDDETISLSELRNMTLGEIVALLGDEAPEDDEDIFADDDSFEDGDAIPAESYGFTGGEGNYKGDQGTYDGKAKRQPVTNHVKGNGDADFGKQDTGYDPDDTEGSEGAEHGAQGTYDGKAKNQPSTDHVKGNGDMNLSKNKTGYRTGSGKKPKNYF